MFDSLAPEVRRIVRIEHRATLNDLNKLVSGETPDQIISFS